MYQRSDLKNLYDRLKAQYPQYGLDFSGDRLTMTRLHSKVEVDRGGRKAVCKRGAVRPVHQRGRRRSG